MLPARFRLERHFALHEHSVRAALSSSDCDALTLAETVASFDEALQERWASATLGYTDARGWLGLREEVARDHAGVSADDVLLVVPQEGILLALAALVAPGTPVIVTTPAYQSLVEIARFAGGSIHAWEPREAGEGFCFEIDDLAALLRATQAAGKPPLVIVNFPHNPTGALPTPAEQSRLFALVAAHGGRVFADEMYRHLELEGRGPLPSAASLDARAVALGGLSKSLAAPGLRMGWLVSRDRALLADIAARKDWTTLCAPGPTELLAMAVLARRREIEARNRGIIEANVAAVRALQTAQPGPVFLPPAGGSVALLRLRARAAELTALCERVRYERDALLVPVSMFENAPGGRFDDCVRLGLGRAALADDLARTWSLLR